MSEQQEEQIDCSSDVNELTVDKSGNLKRKISSYSLERKLEVVKLLRDVYCNKQ